MKVLVTGATGLVGVHALVELLNSGKSARAVVRSKSKLKKCLEPFTVDISKLEIVEGDITHTDLLASYISGCDALVHCAGIFSNDLADKDKIRRLNVEGTRCLLLEAQKQQLDPMIYISSYLALFPPAGTVLSEREQVKSPKEMYSSSKAEAERFVRAMQDEQDAPVVSIYPGSIHGPHDPSYGIGSQILAQAVRSRKMLVTEGGRGYTDVRDLAKLIDRATVAGKGPKRYMFGGYFLKHSEVLAILEKITHRKIKPINIPGVILRAIGKIADTLSIMTGKKYLLNREAAEVLTRSVPTDDSLAIRELELELIGVENSFGDLLSWMKATGRIRY